MGPQLFPYQSSGLDAGRAHFRAGARAVLFVGPTGIGKTEIASAAAIGSVARGARVVAIAHRTVLVQQMAERFRKYGLDVGAGGTRPAAHVQVVSIQSILARREMPAASLVILDEAHHYAADEYGSPVREYLKRGAKIMGLSATPERDDGRGLGGTDGIFDALVVVAQISDLVKINAEHPMRGITPLELVVADRTPRKLAQAPVDAYVQHARDRSCVVFSPNVLNAEAFAKAFVERGIPAGIVHGKLDDVLRDEALARFASGEIKVIVNVNVLTEGWDCPRCDVVMLARKIGSRAFLIQTIGRARRPAPHLGKSKALLIDLGGNIDMHGDPDEDSKWSLEGIACTRARQQTGPRKCRTCGCELARDPDLSNCPECNEPVSSICLLTPEEIELRKIESAEARRRTPDDTKTKALATLYKKGLLKGGQRRSAEFGFKAVFKHWPPTAMRAEAWRRALEMVEKEKGDAWEPPTEQIS